MNTTAIVDRLRFARAYCAEHLPWFAPALYTAHIRLTDQVPVAAVDQHLNIYWNPSAVQAICESTRGNSTEEARRLGFLWIHEISHILRDHADRCQEIKAVSARWNIAADLEINDGVWQPLVMPEQFPGLLPSAYKLPDGKIAEWYYNHLPADEASKPGYGDEGSGVHSHLRIWEEGGTGQEDAQDGQNQRQILHPVDIALIKRQTANELGKAIQSGKLAGNIPGSWRQWVERVLRSRTDWRRVLRHRMSVAIATGVGARVDYSYRRPSRRQSVYAPIIRPTFAGDRSARVACVVDTSGSMGADDLASALGEVFGVLQAFNVPVTVIPCDAASYEPIVLQKPSDVFRIKALAGGGGTDMTVGIRAALALHPKPDSVLVLTDGYTPYPPAPFTRPVVFGILCEYKSKDIPIPLMPPWQEDAVVWIERG